MSATARTTDPSTSHAAAATVNRPRSQSLVLYVLGAYPMTDDQIIWYLHGKVSPSRARTARKELVDLGLVRSTGRTETLRSGRQAVVWEVAS